MIDWLTVPNLASYTLHGAILGFAALVAPRLAGVSAPRTLERYWSWALVAVILGPFWPALVPAAQPESPGTLRLAIETVAGAVSVDRSPPLLPVLGCVTLALLAWRGLGWLRLDRLRRASQRIPVEELGVRLPAQRPLRVEYFRCAQLDGPLTFGFWRHAILLPPSFFALRENERRAVLVHELLHVGRRDWLRLLSYEALRSALWFQPVIHLVLDAIYANREQVVDSKSIDWTRDRRSYLEALTTVALSRLQRDPIAAPLFLERGALKKRVRTILEVQPMSPFRSICFAAGMLAALAAVGLLAQQVFPVALRAADNAQVHKVGDGVEAPKLLEKVEPVYTDEAKEAKLRGTVVLAVEVHPDGRAHNIRVLEGLGMGLDEKAIEAVERWRFEPGRKDGEAVAVQATIEINFRLL